ncbi:hypothetical protein EBH_0011330 [Eimeria brunetti]|uniref:Uncharacterized protein n=1 Tax=Eimeria brunetti TaxID=51314 RepID=U6LAH3_9EIME|nr:hypothetical protein EBH_0011330 [Eimeria brunetti]
MNMELERQDRILWLVEYLEGDALGYWLHLRETGVETTDWPLLKQDMQQCFGSTEREALLYQMAANKLHGHYEDEIVSRSARRLATHLIGYFLASLLLELSKATIHRDTANVEMKSVDNPLQGLCLMLASPEPDERVALMISDERQGALCFVMIGHYAMHAGGVALAAAPTREKDKEDFL